MKKKAILHQELKHKFIIDQLLESGITKSQEGIDIRDCDYETLKSELVLQTFREIDVENDKNMWF